MRVIFNLFVKAILLVLIGIVIYETPFLYQELSFMIKPFDSYQVDQTKDGLLDTGSTRIISPKSTKFGLVIPKIGINVVVYDDGLNHEQGIVHQEDSSRPGSKREVILKTFNEDKEFINRNNSVFPVMHRLIPGDEIIVYYNDIQRNYQVEETRIVSTKEYDKGLKEEYLNSIRIDTNWPPGLYIQKLLVYATLIE